MNGGAHCYRGRLDRRQLAQERLEALFRTPSASWRRRPFQDLGDIPPRRADQL